MARGVVARIVIGVVLAAGLGVWFLVNRDAPVTAEATAVSFEIVSPTVGSTLTGPVTFEVALTNAKLGEPVNGLDHLHLSLDGGPAIAEYASTRLALTIPPGNHVLHVELAGPDHAGLVPVQSVSFIVTG